MFSIFLIRLDLLRLCLTRHLYPGRASIGSNNDERRTPAALQGALLQPVCELKLVPATRCESEALERECARFVALRSCSSGGLRIPRTGGLTQHFRKPRHLTESQELNISSRNPSDNPWGYGRPSQTFISRLRAFQPTLVLQPCLSTAYVANYPD